MLTMMLIRSLLTLTVTSIATGMSSSADELLRKAIAETETVKDGRFRIAPKFANFTEDEWEAHLSATAALEALRNPPVQCQPDAHPPEVCPGGIPCPHCGKPTCVCPGVSSRE